ncbi:MAG: type II toxin-antitoxin system HigB family toxin [Acidobacteria bacterium]|nr:type II toxin-antitoxin system HigB family toxin [Acidobacteriota bacterium]MBI3425756.1 type II toxin-antitoxin system HigB family toxin [Acidobacteriota bacterium]
MRIVSRKMLRAFWERQPDARQPLEDWYRITKNANWSNLAETRGNFAHADLAGNCTIFNIGGNKYRLITKINFRWKMVYIRFVLTHAEYDRGGYANDCAS